MNINLSVGDGTGLHHVSVAQAWQRGIVYTVKAVITATGPQQLSLNGQALGTAEGVFKPAQGAFFGASSFSVAPNGNNPVPLPLVLIAGTIPWSQPFAEDCGFSF